MHAARAALRLQRQNLSRWGLIESLLAYQDHACTPHAALMFTELN